MQNKTNCSLQANFFQHYYNYFFNNTANNFDGKKCAHYGQVLVVTELSTLLSMIPMQGNLLVVIGGSL